MKIKNKTLLSIVSYAIRSLFLCHVFASSGYAMMSDEEAAKRQYTDRLSENVTIWQGRNTDLTHGQMRRLERQRMANLSCMSSNSESNAYAPPTSSSLHQNSSSHSKAESNQLYNPQLTF